MKTDCGLMSQITYIHQMMEARYIMQDPEKPSTLLGATIEEILENRFK
jgi:hypothetical protein